MKIGTPGSTRPARKSALVVAYVLACLVPLVDAGLYAHARRAAGVADGFPLDDSWIHAQYARTIAEGRPFEYVRGERSVGTTSVPFDLLWGGVAAITGEYVHTAHVLNTLLTVATAPLIVALLLWLELPPLTAGIGAALILAACPFPWSCLSGMETALATFLTTAAVLAHVTARRRREEKGSGTFCAQHPQGRSGKLYLTPFPGRRGWRMLLAPVLMGLAAVSRPENLVLYPLSELDNLLQRRREGGGDGAWAAARRVAARGLAFGIVLVPWFALNWCIHGGLLPQTFAAKVGPDSLMGTIAKHGIAGLGLRLLEAWVSFGRAFGAIWLEGNAVLLVPVSLGAISVLVHRRRGTGYGGSLLPMLLLPVGTLATGLMTRGRFFPGQSQRYLIQWIPMLLIYGVLEIHLIARAAGRLLPARPGAAYAGTIGLAAALSMALVVGRWPKLAGEYVTSVKNINEMQVTLAHWVRCNTPPGAVVATNDIGAIAFFGDRPVVDTIGLIDSEMVRCRRSPHFTEEVIAYLHRRGVSYALLFPTWHPDLVLDPRFRGIGRVVLADNLVCGDREMVVMELDWDRKHAEPQPEWMAGVRERCRRLMELGWTPLEPMPPGYRQVMNEDRSRRP